MVLSFPPRWEGRVAGADGEVPERVAAGGVEVVLFTWRQPAADRYTAGVCRWYSCGAQAAASTRNTTTGTRIVRREAPLVADDGELSLVGMLLEQMLAQEFVGGEGLPGHVAHADLTVSTLELVPTSRLLARRCAALFLAATRQSGPCGGERFGSLDAVRRGPDHDVVLDRGADPGERDQQQDDRGISTPAATAAPIPIAATIISTPTTF